MYLPKHFEETRVEVLHELIHAQPLGALATLAASGLDANHMKPGDIKGMHRALSAYLPARDHTIDLGRPVCRVQWMGMEQRLVLRTIELLAERVLPLVAREIA